MILTPIPYGWTDTGRRSQKGCPYSLPLPARPFLKSFKSHPRWSCQNSLLEKSTGDLLATTSSFPLKNHKNLWKQVKQITASLNKHLTDSWSLLLELGHTVTFFFIVISNQEFSLWLMCSSLISPNVFQDFTSAASNYFFCLQSLFLFVCLFSVNNKHDSLSRSQVTYSSTFNLISFPRDTFLGCVGCIRRHSLSVMSVLQRSTEIEQKVKEAQYASELTLLLLSAVTNDKHKWPSSTGSHSCPSRNSVFTLFDRWCGRLDHEPFFLLRALLPVFSYKLILILSADIFFKRTNFPFFNFYSKA